MRNLFIVSVLPSIFLCLGLFRNKGTNFFSKWSLSANSRILHSYGDFTIADEGLQILTFARHIEQWGFFNVPHRLRHGPTVYNGHLRGPVTLTPVAERLAVELSLPVFTNRVCRDRESNPDLPHTRRTLYLYARWSFSDSVLFVSWCCVWLVMVCCGSDTQFSDIDSSWFCLSLRL